MNENTIKRGSVYYLKYDDSWGKELSAGRPAVVLSNTQEIMNQDCVVVALMTNTPRPENVKVNVNSHTSYVAVNQIRTVDKSRLNIYSGSLSRAEMQMISKKLLYTLSLAGFDEIKETDFSKTINTNKQKENDTLDARLYKDLYEKAVKMLVETRVKLEKNQLQRV